jgi:hypothetical protein
MTDLLPRSKCGFHAIATTHLWLPVRLSTLTACV